MPSTSAANVSRTAGQTSPGAGRLFSLDTLRGALILLILVTHGLALLNPHSMSARTHEAAEVLFGVATPSFVLISGTLFGLFLATRRNLTPIFHSYRVRALLFLGFAHILIAIELFPVFARGMPFWRFLICRWYITDTLAIAFLLMPAVLPSVRLAGRLGLGIALLAASRVDAVLAWGHSRAMLIVHETLFGRPARVDAEGFDCYPLLPILGYFMIGSFIGARLGADKPTERQPLLARPGRVAALLLAASLVMCGTWAALRFRLPGHTLVQALLYPDRTFSLFPAYLGGFLLALSLLRRRVDLGRIGRVTRALAMLGRRSLFAFVAQYCVMLTIPALLGHRFVSVRGLLLYLPFAMLAVFGLTAGWDRLRGRPAPPAPPASAAGPPAPGPGEPLVADGTLVPRRAS